MRFNVGTTREIKTLEELTSAGCSVTPRLLGVKIDVQDNLVLEPKSESGFEAYRGHDIDWWMPGGYIVYILMTRLQAQPLDINTFWNEKIFTKQDRDNVRIAFQKSYMSVPPPNHILNRTYDRQRAPKVRHHPLRHKVREPDVGQDIS